MSENMDFQFSKAALLQALENRRKWAIALDAKNIRKHAAAEVSYLTLFKKELKAALKWDYKTAKKNGFRLPSFNGYGNHDRPTCPSSFVQSLNTTIDHIKRDGRTRYSITSSGMTSKIHWLLTYDENAKPNVC